MAYFMIIGLRKLEGQKLTRPKEGKLILIKHKNWSESDMLQSLYLQEVHTEKLKAENSQISGRSWKRSLEKGMERKNLYLYWLVK